MNLKKITEVVCDITVKIYKYIVVLLFAVIQVWLFLLSGFDTSYISADVNEHTYLLKDNIWINLAVELLFILVLTALPVAFSVITKRCKKAELLYNRVLIGETGFAKCRWLLLLCVFVVGTVWVLSSQYIPGADQYCIMNAANGLRTKDYSMFTTGGYVEKYPNQIGIVVILYLLSFVFGNYNYVMFELLNVIGLVVILKQLSEIAGIFGVKKKGQLFVVLLGMLFLPLVLYVSFVYGTILGLAFSLVAIKYELLSFENYKRKYLLFLVFAITVAVMFKSNYLIFMIGMIILALVEMLVHRKLKLILIPIAVIVTYLLQSAVTTGFVEQRTGCDLHGGMSSWSWIAMGLQNNEARCAGWYNAYNELSYKESDYHKQVQAQAAKEDIKKSLDRFGQDKAGAILFFAEKTASQWNDPTFQGFWVLQVRETNIKPSSWLTDMMSVPNSYRIANYLNLLQFIILSGVLLDIMLQGIKCEPKSLVLKVIFIGGFVFHLIWEAKSQYTLPYFVLLFPYAIAGYTTLTGKIRMLLKELELQGIGKTGCKREIHLTIESCFQVVAIAAPILIFAVTAGMCRSQYAKNLVFLGDDTKSYQEYVDNHTINHVLDDGAYRICTGVDSKLVLSIKDTKAENSSDVELSRTEDNATTRLAVSTYDGITKMQFITSGLYLDLYNNDETDNQKVEAYVKNASSAQDWRLKKIVGADGFYILIGSHSALTYNIMDNSVFIRDFKGTDDQKWAVRP